MYTQTQCYNIQNDSILNNTIVLLNMLYGWEKFKGWVVLKFFLHNPTTSIYTKELSRKLKISPLTASVYLNGYEREEILIKRKVGNVLNYTLNNELPLVKELKKCYILATLKENKFVEKVLKENPQTTSIILYGTCASGEYDERSDLDLLTFSRIKKIPKKAISAIKVLDKEVTLNILTLNEWRRTEPSFRKSVEDSYIVLYGTGLVK